MTPTTSSAAAEKAPLTAARYVLGMAWRIPLFIGVLVTILSAAAGRWDLWAVWAYALVFAGAVIAGTIVVARTDPTLFQERLHPGPGGRDPYLRIVASALLLVHWIVAGLDVGRFHWLPPVPTWVQVLGMVLLASSLGMSSWAVGANRFFSSEARIQRDRGHHVITTGPYEYIRHPGYAAALAMMVASPLALGSYLSALPLLGACAMILRRLLIEEKLLRAELEGYASYAAQVRYRIVPGIW